MDNYILEVCVDSADSALAAEKGGATRIELCSALVIGGVTPTPSLFEAVRKVCSINIHVLIRPRFGDFCYSEREFEVIRNEVALYRDLGADGVVIGCLLPDGSLDIERMKILKEEAGHLSVTLHRAFDMCRDPFAVLEQAERLGIHTILTSGQKQNCTLGTAMLTELSRRAGSRICIMAGGGISAEVIETLQPAAGLHAFHLSGKTAIDSRMTYRKPDVHMGIDGISEYDIWMTDEERIRAAARVLKRL